MWDAPRSRPFAGARYSVPPGFIGAVLTVRHRLSSPTIEIVSRTGALVAVHRRATGGLVRTPEHRAAFEAAVLGVFSMARPCVPKGNHPPGPAARALAAALCGMDAHPF